MKIFIIFILSLKVGLAQVANLSCFEEDLNNSESCMLVDDSTEASLKRSMKSIENEYLEKKYGKIPKYAYVAIAGSGIQFETWLGHAFIIFTEEEGIISNQRAYQYNFIQHIPGVELKDEDIGNFVISKESAVEIVNRYLAQDRSVILYKVELHPNSVKKLFINIEKEMLDREVNPKKDYDVVHNNCLSNLVKQINLSLQKNEKKIKTAWDKQWFELNKINIFDKMGVSANNPFFLAPLLDRHPKFKQSQIFLPKVVTDIKYRVPLVKLMRNMAASCKWNENLTGQYEKILLNEKTSVSKAFLTFMQKKVQICVDTLKDNAVESETRMNFMIFISLLSSSTEDYELQMKIRSFELQ